MSVRSICKNWPKLFERDTSDAQTDTQPHGHTRTNSTAAPSSLSVICLRVKWTIRWCEDCLRLLMSGWLLVITSYNLDRGIAEAGYAWLPNWVSISRVALPVPVGSLSVSCGNRQSNRVLLSCQFPLFLPPFTRMQSRHFTDGWSDCLVPSPSSAIYTHSLIPCAKSAQPFFQISRNPIFQLRDLIDSEIGISV